MAAGFSDLSSPCHTGGGSAGPRRHAALLCSQQINKAPYATVWPVIRPYLVRRHTTIAGNGTYVRPGSLYQGGHSSQMHAWSSLQCKAERDEERAFTYAAAKLLAFSLLPDLCTHGTAFVCHMRSVLSTWRIFPSLTPATAFPLLASTRGEFFPLYIRTCTLILHSTRLDSGWSVDHLDLKSGSRRMHMPLPAAARPPTPRQTERSLTSLARN